MLTTQPDLFSIRAGDHSIPESSTSADGTEDSRVVSIQSVPPPTENDLRRGLSPIAAFTVQHRECQQRQLDAVDSSPVGSIWRRADPGGKVRSAITRVAESPGGLDITYRYAHDEDRSVNFDGDAAESNARSSFRRIHGAIVPTDIVDSLQIDDVAKFVATDAAIANHRLIRWTTVRDSAGAVLRLRVAAGDAGKIDVPRIRFVTPSTVDRNTPPEWIELPPLDRTSSAVWRTEGLRPASRPETEIGRSVDANVSKADGPQSGPDRFGRWFTVVGDRWSIARVPRQRQTRPAIVASLDTRLRLAGQNVYAKSSMIIQPGAAQTLDLELPHDADALLWTVEGGRNVVPIRLSKDRYRVALPISGLPQRLEVLYKIDRSKLDPRRSGATPRSTTAADLTVVPQAPIIRQWATLLSTGPPSSDGDRSADTPPAIAEALAARRISLASALVDAIESATAELRLRSQAGANVWLDRRMRDYANLRQSPSPTDAARQPDSDQSQSLQRTANQNDKRFELLDRRLQTIRETFGRRPTLIGSDPRAEPTTTDSTGPIIERSAADELMDGLTVTACAADPAAIVLPTIATNSYDNLLRWFLVRIGAVALVLTSLWTIGWPPLPSRTLRLNPAIWMLALSIAGLAIWPWPIMLATAAVAVVLGYNSFDFGFVSQWAFGDRWRQILITRR